MPTPRKISRENVAAVAELMKKRMYTSGEILKILRETYHYYGSIAMFFGLMERQGIPVFEEYVNSTTCLYKVLTNEDLEKEEERRRNATRCLLASVSS